MPLRGTQHLKDWIKRICIIPIIVFTIPFLKAQTIYLTNANNLYRLNLELCVYELVVDVNTGSIADITFHPDGTLYGINPGGELFEIDTITGNVTIVYDFPGLLFGALTSSNEGIIYTADRNGEFWSYQKSTGIATYLGNIGYGYAGDLAFYKGELYMSSVFDDLIIKVDIDNPSNSVVVMTNAGGFGGGMYGIVTYARDCNDVRFYGIVSGNYTVLEIDLDALTSDTICVLDRLFAGAATSHEFIASAPVKVVDTLISNPDCGTSNGLITVTTTGGTPPYEYSINGGPLQDQDSFENLSAGEYQIVIIDSRGCSTSLEIELNPQDISLIDSIHVVSETCDQQNGQISITPLGSETMQYSIDGLNFQTSNRFDSIDQGFYEITVSNIAGCQEKRVVEVPAISPASINNIQITPTSCGQTNGAILILTENGNNVSYSINEINFQNENIFNQLMPGDYIVSILDENGCTDEKIVSIPLSVTLIIDTIEINHPSCHENNGSINFNIEGSTGQVSYFLNNANQQQTSTFSQLDEGIYTWSINDEAGCTLQGAVELTRSITYIVESIAIKASDCGKKNGSIEIRFANSHDHIAIYLNGSLVDQTSIKELASGTYDLTFIDEKGCILDTTTTVPEGQCEIFIPNIFSPNGDGINDDFRLTSAESQTQIKKYLIFDRWGSIVYSAHDFPIDNQELWWDGHSKEKNLSPGTYIYYIEVEHEGGIKDTYTGDITLIR